MSTELVRAIDEAVAYVRANPDRMSRDVVDRFRQLAEQVYILAVQERLDPSLPQVSELRPQLENRPDLPALAPVQFETKLNLPGDWDQDWPADDDNISRLRFDEYANLLLIPAVDCQSDTTGTDEVPPGPEPIFLPCCTARWLEDMDSLRKLAELSCTRVPVETKSEVPASQEMPWEGQGGWDPPSNQIRRLFCFMVDRQQAEIGELEDEVWGKAEVSDQAIKTALSRLNKYLGKIDYHRSLEKDGAIIRWV